MHFVKNDLIIFVFISVGKFCQIQCSVSSRNLRAVFMAFLRTKKSLFDKTQQLYLSLYYYIRLLLAGAIAIELSIQ